MLHGSNSGFGLRLAVKIEEFSIIKLGADSNKLNFESARCSTVKL